MQQEVFGFHKTEHLDWGDFIESDENRAAVVWLAQWPHWNSHGLIIYGESGVGKTHIASLWAQTANAVYVLKSSLNSNPRLLFENNCNFVIDNFDDFLNYENYDWMFHFFNIAQEQNRYFLLISRIPPSLWKIKLNDLRSRLLTLPVINIHNPEDELLIKITQKLSKDFGVIISNETIRYMLKFIDRNVSAIAQTLKILDVLSLQQQKPITIPFIKNCLFIK